MRENLTYRPKLFMPVTPVALAITTAVVGISINSIPNGASGAIIANQQQEVAYGFHTAIDTQTGIILPAKANVEVNRVENLQSLRFLRTSGTDGRIVFHFYTEP